MTNGTLAALVVGHDEGEALWFTNNRTLIKVRAADTGGAYGLIETIAPPASSPPLHVHSNEDETFLVLAGRLTVRVGDADHVLGAGDLAFGPRGVPHTYVVEGDEPARIFTFITPGGMEQFFAHVGRPAEGPGLPPAGPPDIEALVRGSAEFGIDVVGPPMAPPAR